jgi:hypothetical protein
MEVMQKGTINGSQWKTTLEVGGACIYQHDWCNDRTGA